MDIRNKIDNFLEIRGFQAKLFYDHRWDMDPLDVLTLQINDFSKKRAQYKQISFIPKTPEQIRLEMIQDFGESSFNEIIKDIKCRQMIEKGEWKREFGFNSLEETL